ncbi:MAG: hypothetical protein ACK55I_06165, partial [bacterium]
HWIAHAALVHLPGLVAGLQRARVVIEVGGESPGPARHHGALVAVHRRWNRATVFVEGGQGLERRQSVEAGNQPPLLGGRVLGPAHDHASKRGEFAHGARAIADLRDGGNRQCGQKADDGVVDQLLDEREGPLAAKNAMFAWTGQAKVYRV